MLPPLFEMDDYNSCIQNGSRYCKVDAVLEVAADNIKLLQHIKDVMFGDKFDRRIIHRALCLPKGELPDNQPIEQQLTKLVDKKLEIYNLTTKVDYHLCTNGKTSITEFDNFMLFLAVAYILFLLFATYNSAKKKMSSKENETILSYFSLLENWKKRTSHSKNEDYHKLLSIQGFRVVLMTIIILTHVVGNYLFVYLENPELLEQCLSLKGMDPLQYILPTFILSFFIISSWLSTLQAYNILEQHGTFTIKHVGIIIINRYFRLIPALFVLLVWRTNWVRLLEGPLNFDLIDINQNACKNNWLNKVLYINNFSSYRNLCSPYSWSLSADFQMFIITILILYLIFKFKLNEFRTFGMVLAIFCMIQSSVLYYYDMNLFRVNIKNVELRYFKSDEGLFITYLSTVAIASSSCIGMIMGAIYYKTKRLTFEYKPIYSVLWATLFIGLPTLSIVLCMNKFGRLEGAIVASIIKPIFCLGIGIGILGMTHNLGGILKRFLENKYVVFLSNFSYCIYLCQEFLILHRHRNLLLKVNASILLSDIMVVYSTSVILGIFLTLAIEEPCYSLQKKILPQIKRDGKGLGSKRN